MHAPPGPHSPAPRAASWLLLARGHLHTSWSGSSHWRRASDLKENSEKDQDGNAETGKKELDNPQCFPHPTPKLMFSSEITSDLNNSLSTFFKLSSPRRKNAEAQNVLESQELLQLGWLFLFVQSIFLLCLALREQCLTEPARTYLSSCGWFMKVSKEY